MRTRTILILQMSSIYFSENRILGFLKKIFVLTAICIYSLSYAFAQQWEATGALAASGKDWYLTGATSVGNDLFAVNYNQNLVYSSDLGKTWSAPVLSKPEGTFAYILGIENRLYASMKLNTYDHNLLYSTDKGASWQTDTVGLPKSLTKTGKSGMLLKYMGDNYVLAHNYLTAYYKKVGETSWKSTYIDFAIVDIAAIKDKWLAIGAGKILQSTNNGISWSTMVSNGLPASFQGSLICSNGTRIFLLNNAATGAETIYFSDDGGSNWTKTNSGGKFNYDNPWVQSMYAVENYMFAGIRPKFANNQDAPPFIVSSTSSPDFSVGDVTGLQRGVTNTYLPFFFHVGNKLFTMFWDLYSLDLNSSTPTALSGFNDLHNEVVTVYPNPASQSILVQTNNIEISNLEIFNLSGKKVFQTSVSPLISIRISDWSTGIYMIKVSTNKGLTYHSKFIKN